MATMTVLVRVLYCYVTSFSYEGKKTKNVGLTCRCRLIVTMNYSVFFMKA